MAILEIEHMDWYLSEESDDLIVPNEREALEAPSMEDVSPSKKDWYQWEVTRSKNIGSPNTYSGTSTIPSVEGFNFDRQSLYVQISKEPPICEGEASSSSSTCGQHPLTDCSERTSQASYHGQPDFQLQNSERMDDIFLNSFLEEDEIFADSVYRSLSFEDLLSNMPVDPQNLMDPSRRGSTAYMNACRFPLIVDDIMEDWDKAEDTSLSFFIPDESKRSEGSPMSQDPNLTVFIPAVRSATNESEEVADVDEPKCLEATVLLELEDVMIQLSKKTRICFRDALYRLAKSSKKQHTMNQDRSADFIDRPSIAEVNGESSRMGKSRCVESNTNVIDRAIATLMFNKPYCGPSDLPCPQLLLNSMEDPAASGFYNSWDLQ